MVLRTTLECDLSRQDLGTYRKDGTIDGSRNFPQRTGYAALHEKL